METFMEAALAEARLAFEEGEVPVGAVVVYNGQVIAKAHNRREQSSDPTAHAEILALRAAGERLGTRRLRGCQLYVTLEPCPMCAGAMVMAELERCYFGANDPRQGCAESVYALTQDPCFYHRLPCIGGILAEEAQALLTDFFAAKR
ncbi:MAG: tRNA adenosine(34) deaminase TadA [Eubacteriales bacterium]|nr:tRNA adenosine(34) deaminase TadA [Eubacteriales bacterium]